MKNFKFDPPMANQEKLDIALLRYNALIRQNYMLYQNHAPKEIFEEETKLRNKIFDLMKKIKMEDIN